MCFTFLPACFGAMSSSTRHIDSGGDCNTVMHRECCCFGWVCKVSTNRRDLGAFQAGVRGPRKLQEGHSGRPPRPAHGNTDSLRGGVSFHPSTSPSVRPLDSLDGVGEEIVARRRVNGDVTPQRNSWRDRAMIKLNFCFFFCRGWWAFLLLQLHMLQALAQDDVAPYFKTEPGLPQIHLEGNRLVLTCLVEGSWPLEFKWLRNDMETTAFSSEYKYVIPSLQRSDAGFYQCVVRNRMGALLQRKSEVQVAYMGNFQDVDQRKTVPQGQATVLNFPDITSYPRPQVTWFRDGHKIIPSSRILS